MPTPSNCFGSIFNSISGGIRLEDGEEEHDEQSLIHHEKEVTPSCRCGLTDLQPQSSFVPHLMVSSENSAPAFFPISSQTHQKFLSNPEGNENNSHDELNEYPSILLDQIDCLSDQLRKWSLQIFDFKEIALHEFKTHDLIAEIFEHTPGWKVTRHAYGIETAVEAIFTHGVGGQTVGFNSEMDALPGIGHACGHPLICIAGIAAAMATAHALEQTNTSGKIVLLGTPAEENIGGKIMLIEKGAYRGMDACLMIHPAPFGGMLPMLAISQVKVEYFGKNAHAAGAPWEGINALDAAVSAYNSISLLRQQIHPDERVHGIIQGSENWVSNVIPDYAWLRYDIRAPTRKGMLELKARVLKCFQAAAESTGCQIKIQEEMVYYDLTNNLPLAREYKTFMEKHMGVQVPFNGPSLGSTDFGNVSYEVPSIHPIYAIPTTPGQGNHTIGFTKSAATEEAHQITLKSAKGIAVAGWKVLADKTFAQEVYKAFNER